VVLSEARMWSRRLAAFTAVRRARVHRRRTRIYAVSREEASLGFTATRTLFQIKIREGRKSVRRDSPVDSTLSSREMTSRERSEASFLPGHPVDATGGYSTATVA